MAKTLEEKIDESAKLFDVAKPGSSPATATSRPIIVGHTTIKTDPMMKTKDEKTSDEPLKTHTAAPVIKPLTSVIEAETVEEKPVVDTVPRVVPPKKDKETEAETSIARQAEVEKLIESREFVVPIGQVSRRRSYHRIVIFLVVIVIIAILGVNFAIDAEVLDIGVQSLTDLL